MRIRTLLGAVVIGLWVAILLGIYLRIGMISHFHDVFVTYYGAGRKWIASQPLYSYTRGFVYSPLEPVWKVVVRSCNCLLGYNRGL